MKREEGRGTRKMNRSENDAPLASAPRYPARAAPSHPLNVAHRRSPLATACRLQAARGADNLTRAPPTATVRQQPPPLASPCARRRRPPPHKN
jgi:hypothetical protein